MKPHIAKVGASWLVWHCLADRRRHRPAYGGYKTVYRANAAAKRIYDLNRAANIVNSWR